MCPLSVLFFVSVIKKRKEEVAGSLRAKTFFCFFFLKKKGAALQTGEDTEENCKIVAVDQFIDVLYKNDMKEYYENEPVDQCNVTVNTYGAKLQYDEKATTRANTGLNDRATAQAVTNAEQKEKKDSRNDSTCENGWRKNNHHQLQYRKGHRQIKDEVEKKQRYRKLISVSRVKARHKKTKKTIVDSNIE